MVLPAILSLPLSAAPSASAAEVVIVEGSYLLEREPGEASGMQRYIGNVTDALDLAGVEWEMSSDAAVESSEALADCRVAIFPHNGGMAEGELNAVEGFMDGGGRIILFYSLPARLAERIGVTDGGYMGGEEGRFRFDRIGFHAPDVLGLPETMAQGSWNIHAFKPREGEARVIGTWINQDGEDTGIPAVALGDQGAVMNHVLLNGGPQAARFLMAVIGHWFPDTWESAVDRALTNSEQFGRFGTAEELAEFVDGFGETPGAHHMRDAMERAAEIRAAAQTLADEGKWPDALDALATVPDVLGEGYARLYPPREGEMRAVWSHSPFNVDDWDVACRHLRENGFNAVILNLCNAAVAYYPSRYLKQHPRALEEGDQILRVLQACRENGIELHVWRVNWNPGGDQERIDQIRREGLNAVSIDGTPGAWLCPSQPENRQHEIDAMLEIVRNYDVDGIHLDYIRYHNAKYCYCDHCRKTFEEQIGREIETWPQDVMGDGDLRDQWLQFRRDQINVVVKTVSEEARKLRPGIKISAAVFGEWAASRVSIGQDAKLWVDEGWLDFVCPMDYTNNTDYLRRLTETQVEAVAGQCPLYIGIGAWRHPSIATLVDQIQATRTLGADGFVLFSYEAGKTDEFMTRLGRGQTRGQTYVPHRAPQAAINVPRGPFEGRAYLWETGAEIEAEVGLGLAGTVPRPLTSARARVVLETTEGERLAAMGSPAGIRFAVPEGRSRIAMYGRAVYAGGPRERFVRRGPVLRGLTADEVAQIRAANEPPVFSGEGLKVGVTTGGYASDSMLEALRADPEIDAMPLNKLTPDFLEACNVVVVAQFRQPTTFTKEWQEALVEWVRQGGRVMLMHDAVGYRNHPVLFPEVGTGVGVGDSSEVVLFNGERFEHSYYDHIHLDTSADAIIGVRDLPENGGAPVTAGGEVGQGKVVLNGLVTGLAEGDTEVPPEGLERDLLVLCVKWLAG